MNCKEEYILQTEHRGDEGRLKRQINARSEVKGEETDSAPGKSVDIKANEVSGLCIPGLITRRETSASEHS